MKKVAIVAAVALIGMVTSFAATVGVPHYLDDGNATGAALLPTNDGAATYIALHNLTGSAAVCTVQYFDNDGTARTPAVNTFLIPAGAAFSFRPVATDPSEGAGGAVPNKNGGKVAGTAIVTVPGTAAQWAGRVATHDDDYSYAYTLIFN
ncbi:MAG: hypothetical protein AMXMBFR84_01370 [Candidatus Hydrogenedentota bacterium]